MNGEPLVFHNCILFEHDITNKRGNNHVPAFKKNWSPMTSNTNVPFENEYRAKQYQHPGLEKQDLTMSGPASRVIGIPMNMHIYI